LNTFSSHHGKADITIPKELKYRVPVVISACNTQAASTQFLWCCGTIPAFQRTMLPPFSPRRVTTQKASTRIFTALKN